MFIKDEIQTKVRNIKGLATKLQAGYPQGYNVGHDSKFGVNLLGDEHLGELRELANLLGFDFDSVGYTYTIKVYEKSGKTEVKVYAPRLVLRCGTLMLQWGNSYKPVSELVANQNLMVIPQIVKNDKYTSYTIVIGTDLGDIPFPIYPKEGVEPTTASLTKALKSGDDWKDILEPPYPVELKTLVSVNKQTFEFTAVGFREESKSGTTKDGRKFTIDSLILLSEEGEQYSTKDGKSRNAKDIRYWGEQASPDNPIQITVKFEGIGEFQGKPYTQWGVSCSPVNQTEVSLADLLELADEMDNENAMVPEPESLFDDIAF